jgi:zinc protease
MISRLAIAIALIALPIQTLHAQAPAVQSSTTLSPAARSAWGFDKSDLKADPAVRYGVLPNGMRYAIMRNATPKSNAVVRMRFDVGSTADDEAQRGQAHFLEHMAFNGSKRIPEGEMIKLLERAGLAFGADTNASTGFTETIYKLDLPKVSDDLINTALMIMRETASELTISPAAVERERGVIQGERTARENFGLRQFRDRVNFLVPGTPISKGLPIGTEKTIAATSAAGLRSLYERYYSPERTTLVFVGDIDPSLIEAKILKQFSDWEGKSPVKGSPVKGIIAANRPTSAHLFVDADVPTAVTLSVVKPLDELPDTKTNRARQTAEAIGNAMLNRRLAGLSRKANASFTAAGASSSDFFSTARLTDIGVTAKDRDWKAALTIGEQELRRALLHGFSEGEFKEQIANFRTAIKNAADQAGTRQSGRLADQIVGTLDDNSIFTNPASDLALFEAIAQELLVRDVNSAFRSLWKGAQPLIFVAHNQAISGGDAELTKVFDASTKVAVAPAASNDNQAFAYTNFGTAGTIAADTRIADLDVRTIRFANNVRLNFKKTDFETGKVHVSVRVGGGLLEFPQQPDGLSTFMNTTFGAGGTVAHSGDELQSILAGRSVSFGVSAGIDAFQAGSVTTPQDLELQLQLLTASFTAPGFRPEGEAQWRNLVGAFIPTLDSQPGGVFQRDVTRILASGDTRYGIPSESALKALNFAALKPVVAKSFANGPIEIAIVGDIDEARAVALVAKTFGALPARAADRPDYVKGQSIRFPVDRKPISLTHGGKPDQGIAAVFWPTTDGKDSRIAAQLDLLGSIVGLLAIEELREKLGATYSPQAGSNASDVLPGYGYLSLVSTVDPKQMDIVFAAVDGIAASIAKAPPRADLMNRARNPKLERIIRARRENGRWLGLLDEAQSVPKDLDDYRNAEAMLKAITPQEIQALAKQYMVAKDALRVKILPRAAK